MSFTKLESSSVSDCGIHHRINARSVSWNASGTTLAMAGSDRITHLYNMIDLVSSNSSSNSNSNNSIRELGSIKGHTGVVDRLRFHSTQDSLLATTCVADATVRLWDLRSSAARAVGKIDLVGGTTTNGGNSNINSSSNGSTTDISWSPTTKANFLAITEKNGNCHVVDTRKLGSGGGSHKTPPVGGSNSNNNNNKSTSSPFVKTFCLRPKIVDACVFSPSGDHLVAATSEEGYGELTVWNWETSGSHTNNNPKNNKNNNHNDAFPHPHHVYPAHTGPIYSVCFSPDGRKLATGGGDALVGLWDVASMVCDATIPRCQRFVRSVSVSCDSSVVATSTEDSKIDLGNCGTGALVGTVSLEGSDTSNNTTTTNGSGGKPGGRTTNALRSTTVPGADEIAFHPSAHLLACARCDSAVCAPLTIVTLKLGRH